MIVVVIVASSFLPHHSVLHVIGWIKGIHVSGTEIRKGIALIIEIVVIVVQTRSFRRIKGIRGIVLVIPETPLGACDVVAIGVVAAAF